MLIALIVGLLVGFLIYLAAGSLAIGIGLGVLVFVCVLAASGYRRTPL